MENNKKFTISERIKFLREDMKLSQDELAKTLGITTETIIRIESGEVLIADDIFNKIYSYIKADK
jgi:DNA-binding XRE family transcriptional regulator